MANEQNLKPFKKGYDERRGSKPKGTKHISTYIREILESNDFEYELANGTKLKTIPIEAILKTVIQKAIYGDLRAIDLLAKHGYSNKVDLTIERKAEGPKLTWQQLEAIAKLRKEQEEAELAVSSQPTELTKFTR